MHIHGFKKQAAQTHKPQITPDNLVSVSYFKGLYGLAEGEIYGLADGGKSIKLDGTPLVNDNGQANFTNVNWDFRFGTLDQTHIAGFPAVENETNVGVELRSDRAWVKQITNRELSAVRVRLNFNALREQKDNGDIVGLSIEYAIDVQTDGGSYQEVLRQTVRGKASQGYKKSHRIDLPNAGTAKRWTIRVRRITPNRSSDLVSDTVYIDALTEIIDAKLAYPCTALLGLSYDAKTFANIAKVAIRLKGKIIQVPSNYDADTRQYNGLWDGTFKPAYSNNPAWVYYDLCTHRRYGLGERLGGLVDKWRLYQIAQYCDELVDDGMGGQEPRFTINVYIQKADDAYRVLQNLASVFRGLSFWDGQNIVVDADTPKEPIYTFSPANIVGGEFTYTGTRARDRHTLTKVAWDNPDNGFSTEYELIPDEQAIAKYGVRTLDISAFGCTSQGQAQRAGLWALKSEQLETQTVSFRTGLQGFIPQVGRIINVADNVFAGRAVSGKIKAVSTNKRQITLDRVAGKVGDTLTVNGTTGVESAKVTAVHGNVLTLNKAINAEPEHIWAVIADDLKLKQFRILTIIQNDDATFDITALEYNAQKYAVVDSGAVVTPQPYTALKATPINAPNSVTLTASTRAHQGQAVTTLSINWEQVTGAVAYIVEWRKDDGNWQTLPKVSGQSVDIDGVYSGGYTARVRAVDSFDNESLATTSQLTQITGKQGKPPRLANLNAQGVLFGMNLAWTFNIGSDDTNFTEIQVSPDGRSNIATLGTFAYPTNKHEINGLQGNLTQFYRARIVDKLGNTSDWTTWVSGTTSADASKVLDIISGQIRDSHLDQTLRTPIAKIGGLESVVNAVNAQLPALNNQIATLNGKATSLQSELNTAKSTLQTAVSNITTERNRINTAIRDITALQSANNAKTAELANLTQTVGNHTSSIRELGLTTGELSQKYTALKSASDTANSEITAIKQTQAGQALSVERLGARFDNLKLGGRNLLLHTDKLNRLWRVASFNGQTTMTVNNGIAVIAGKNNGWKHLGYDINLNKAQELLQTDNNFTLSVYIRRVSGANNPINLALRKGITNGFIDHLVGGNVTPTNNWVRYVVKGTIAADDLKYLFVRFEWYDNSVYEFKQPKLEFGLHVTDWTPAPEDVNVDLTPYATNASLNEFKQAQATKDTALSQQINAMDTTYKSADRTLMANLASETATRTTADTVLGQRITAIDTAYKQADNATNAKLANTEKAISDNNTALSQRISALDSAYKKSDIDITARLAREETARADADKANAQALRTLESTVNGIDGRVGASESKIASLERTTADTNQALATTQSQLNARFDNLVVGGRNLLLKSDVLVDDNKYGHDYELSKAPEVGEEVTATVWGNLGDGRSVFAVYNTFGYGELAKLKKVADGVHRATFKWKKSTKPASYKNPDDTHLAIYAYPQSATSNNIIRKIKLERGNVGTDWTPAPEDLQADIDGKATTASLNEFKQTQATKDNATAQKLSQLESGLGMKVNTSALNSLTTKVNQVDGKITAEANKVSQLQTTLNGQTTSIRNVEQSVNGVKAVKAVTVDNNGFISGYGLMSELQNGRVTSRFGVNADQIYFGATTSAKKPFVFTTRTTTIDGVSYPAGAWLNSASIANASIKLAHIDKASIGNLSALSANIGHFKSAERGARLEIKDTVLLVYDANNTLRVRLGLW